MHLKKPNERDDESLRRATSTILLLLSYYYRHKLQKIIHMEKYRAVPLTVTLRNAYSHTSILAILLPTALKAPFFSGLPPRCPPRCAIFTAVILAPLCTTQRYVSTILAITNTVRLRRIILRITSVHILVFTNSIVYNVDIFDIFDMNDRRHVTLLRHI